MASVDPALLARAKAEIEAHPAFRQYVQGRGRAQGGGAIDPRVFGVTYLPPEYKYSLGSRQLVDEFDWGDKAAIGAGAGVLGLAGGLMAAGAPSAAGGAGTTAGVGGTTTGVAAPTAVAPLASSALPASTTSGLMTASAPAIASQGVSAGIPMAAGTASGGGFLSNLLGGIRQDPLGTLGNLGGVLGGAAEGAAQGRRADASAEAIAGRVNLDALALDQRRAALRSLLGGVQDASIGRPAGSTIPTFSVSGGLRPSALSNREALMAELSRPAPTVTPPVAGTGEKILGIGGTIGGILGALRRQPQVMNAGGR